MSSEKKVLDYCYHTHTTRCGHAKGLDEDYVLSAINAGIKNLGFSDHVMLPGYNQPGIRGSIDFLEDYINSINYLKIKYRDQIDIKLGFECEFFDGKFLNYYKSLLNDKKFDYLILGEHCHLGEDGNCFWYGLGDFKIELKRYTNSLIEAMKSGLFTYIAHVDHFMLWYGSFDDFAKECVKEIGEASVKYDVPLELNLGSLRRDSFTPGNEDLDCAYPKVEVWKILSKCGVKCVIGYDAHSPLDFDVSKKKDLPYVWKMIDSLNLSFVDASYLFDEKRRKKLN